MYGHFLCKTAWVLTALAGIHVGLGALGYDLLAMAPFSTSLSGAVIYIKYAYGIAGVLSLAHFFMECWHGCCKS